MLARARVAQALEAERERLQRSARSSVDLLRMYGEAFDALLSSSSAELADRLGGSPWPGGRPTGDMDSEGAVHRHLTRWSSAQEARQWALGQLRGVSTAAVDGSQIAASKEFGTPISLVQIGWFLNHHDPDRPYVKDVRNLLVLPEVDDTDGGDYASAESRVNRCRFIAELDAVREQIEVLAGEARPSVVFFDGTFVLSFAGQIPGAARAGYLNALFQVLDASRERRVPAVGYVDLSYATDLITMLHQAYDLPPARNLFDGQLLASRMEPFDRTAAFGAARGDILPQYRTDGRDYSADLIFLYLQIGPNRPPARLDLPCWVLDDGLLDHVVNVVRAEVVVGSGYPYALETADVTALLSTEDRAAFYRLFEDFAEDAGLQVFLPRKTASKSRRR